MLIDEPNLCFRDLDFDTSCSHITNTYYIKSMIYKFVSFHFLQLQTIKYYYHNKEIQI